MPSSSSQSDPLDPDQIDDVEDEEEYEEIEVEESDEIEVEEYEEYEEYEDIEVEEEFEVEEEIDQDSDPIGDNSLSDISQNEEFELPKQELSAQNELSYVKVEDFRNSLLPKLISTCEENGFTEFAVDEDVVAPLLEIQNPMGLEKEHCPIHVPNTQVLSVCTSNSTDINDRKVNLAIPMKDSSGTSEANDGPNSQFGITKIDLQLGDVKLTASRFSRSGSPQIWTRRLSPGTELKDGNKRQAVICAFFAKGWCIKGSSCKFLHIKDNADISGQQPGEDVDVINQGFKGDEASTSVTGSKDIVKRPKLPYSPGQCATSLGNNITSHFSSECGPSTQHADKQSWKQHHEKHKSSSFAVFDESEQLAATKARPEELVCKSPFMFNNPNAPTFGRPLDSGLNSHYTTNTPPISSWAGSSSSLHDSPNFVDRNGEFHISKSTSMRQSFSPLSGAELGNLHVTNYSWDSSGSSRYKRKISSHDWEPSVPFRSSFVIPSSSISSPRNQYDPLRDSIEHDIAGHNLFSSSHLSMSQQKINGDIVSIGISGSEKVFCPKFRDKKNASYGKGLLSTISELTGNANIESRCVIPNEAMELGSDNAKEITDADEMQTDLDSRQNNFEARHKESKVDERGYKESKALRHFRATLVNFVKELIKPTWHDGHLSKDAYKMIVKKAVDKVLSASLPLHIPNNLEAVRHYLSSSRPKILKLVEGYIGKYGKPELQD